MADELMSLEDIQKLSDGLDVGTVGYARKKKVDQLTATARAAHEWKMAAENLRLENWQLASHIDALNKVIKAITPAEQMLREENEKLRTELDRVNSLLHKDE